MKSDSSNHAVSSGTLDDDSVSKYLIENPDFFNRKADLLLELTIPHVSGGAISLLERQVALFRERNRDLQNNINNFIFNAEENDALFEKTRIVILEIIKSDSLKSLSSIVADTLKTEFSADASNLLFIADKPTAMPGKKAFTFFPPDQPGKKWASFLRKNVPSVVSCLLNRPDCYSLTVKKKFYLPPSFRFTPATVSVGLINTARRFW